MWGFFHRPLGKRTQAPGLQRRSQTRQRGSKSPPDIRAEIKLLHSVLRPQGYFRAYRRIGDSSLGRRPRMVAGVPLDTRTLRLPRNDLQTHRQTSLSTLFPWQCFPLFAGTFITRQSSLRLWWTTLWRWEQSKKSTGHLTNGQRQARFRRDPPRP